MRLPRDPDRIAYIQLDQPAVIVPERMDPFIGSAYLMLEQAAEWLFDEDGGMLPFVPRSCDNTSNALLDALVAEIAVECGVAILRRPLELVELAWSQPGWQVPPILPEVDQGLTFLGLQAIESVLRESEEYVALAVRQHSWLAKSARRVESLASPPDTAMVLNIDLARRFIGAYHRPPGRSSAIVFSL